MAGRVVDLPSRPPPALPLYREPMGKGLENGYATTDAASCSSASAKPARVAIRSPGM